MFVNGFCHTRPLCWALPLVLVHFLAVEASAQSDPRFIAPVPLPSPYAELRPLPVGYGPRPMPIGPAPYPTIVGRPMVVAPAYPVVVSPQNPYWARQPSPFEPVPNMPGSRQIVTARPSDPVPFSVPSDSQIATDFPTPVPVIVPTGNLRCAVSERFLNRLVARDEQHPGEVRDFILGADVRGFQTTDTKLRIDLIPSSDKIRANLVLNGLTNSQTTGTTSQAMVDVASRQRFVAVKDLLFDGIYFSTRHAVIHVQAQNQTLGAKTALSGTIFGGIADRIAFREAERRKPEAEAVARDRVAERVYPEFDNEVDRNLAKANEQLESVVRPLLRQRGLFPNRQAVSSTDSCLTFVAQLGDQTAGADVAPQELLANDGPGVYVAAHESLLNEIVSVSGLKGLKTTDKEIEKWLSPYEVKPTEDEVAQKPVAKSLPGFGDIVSVVELDDVNPLSLKVEGDIYRVTLRGNFKPGGQDMLPPLAVSIDYKPELSGDKLIVTPNNVQVAFQRPEDGTTAANLALKLISQGIEANISKLAVSRTLPTQYWPFAGAAPRIVEIRTVGKWSTVVID